MSPLELLRRTKNLTLRIEILSLTYIGGHSFEILGLPLPGPALLSRRRDDSGPVEVGDLGRGARVRDGRRGRLERYRAHVAVGVLGVHGVVRVVMVMVEEFGRGEGLAGVMGAGGVNRDRRALGGVELGAHLVVQPTEHSAVPHPEVIALGERDRASGAREATHVEHQLPGPHHQLRGEDRRVAAGASLHAAEHPGKKNET